MTFNFEQLVNRMKDAPEFGGGFSSDDLVKSRSRLHRMMGWEDEKVISPFEVKKYLGYFAFQFQTTALQPIAAVVSVFAIVFGGWIASVNASFNSVPGDVLYPVKLATERMQLRFAGSGEQRALLHAEFAGRRLQEAATIVSSGRNEKEGMVKTAVKDFADQVSFAEAELAQLAADKSPDAASLAVSLDQKTDEFKTFLNQTAPVASGNMKSEVKNVEAVMETTSNKVVSTLVKLNDSDDSDVTLQELEQTFQKRYRDLTTRLMTSIGRTSVFQAAIEKTMAPAARAELAKKLGSIQSALQAQNKVMAEALNMFAAGGYQGAFANLNRTNDTVRSAEDILTGLEIDFTTNQAGR